MLYFFKISRLLRFYPNKPLLFACAINHEFFVSIFDTESGDLRGRLDDHQGAVTDVDFFIEKDIIVTYVYKSRL